LQINTDFKSLKNMEFFGPTETVNVIERNEIPITAKLIPKIDRGFFLAQGEWTCYRRNYFQLSSAFEFSDKISDIKNVTVFGKRISNFMISLRARDREKEIILVQHTTKREKGNALTPDKLSIEPGGDPFRYTTVGSKAIVTYERVQFKSATPNNGKRKAPQVYFNLIVDLYAVVDGSLVLICYCESSRLIVRGRSPAHYPDEKAHDASTTPQSTTNSPFTPTGQLPRIPTPNRFMPYPIETKGRKAWGNDVPVGSIGSFISNEPFPAYSETDSPNSTAFSPSIEQQVNRVIPRLPTPIHQERQIHLPSPVLRQELIGSDGRLKPLKNIPAFPFMKRQEQSTSSSEVRLETPSYEEFSKNPQDYELQSFTHTFSGWDDHSHQYPESMDTHTYYRTSTQLTPMEEHIAPFQDDISPNGPQCILDFQSMNNYSTNQIPVEFQVAKSTVSNQERPFPFSYEQRP
jgi:hypothetical protein